MNKQKITIVILSVALFALAQYIIYEKIIESRQQELTLSYQNGYVKGLADTITTIFRQTENCHVSTITSGNLTKSLFDLSCLNVQKNNMTR
jgi:hypothetical protein